MKIIHYFLGFPPLRSGGLTNFCVDLMNCQKNNDDVVALWPGRIKVFNKKVYIKKNKNVNGIKNYEIINPLPVSLDEGIKDFDRYMSKTSSNCFDEFFSLEKPDVIHVHTLMGLHNEFIISAKKNNIPIIYTTHDYFGICPKVTLFKNNHVCDNDHCCNDCISCNSQALSYNKIVLLQSFLYRKLKNTKLFQLLRKKHRNNFFENDVIKNETNEEDLANKYVKLRNFYLNMLNSFDLIHFNSSLTSKIYSKYLKPKNSKILTISNRDIKDNRNMEHCESDKLRITYLASTKKYKGFGLLKSVLDDIWNNENKNFSLNVYAPIAESSEYMNIFPNGFKRDELQKIFSNTDILIAPSICYETFGFTVLEALSYGVPVIVSDNVGSKDIVESGGIIIKSGDFNQLKNVILSLNKEKIKGLKSNIKSEVQIKTFDKFCDECKKMYMEVID